MNESLRDARRPLVACPEFDRHELRIYEEVAKVPPFRRKTLVLIGAQGVGRRSLKNKLMVSDPQRYGTTVPCECSRSPVRTSASSRFPGWIVFSEF